MIEIGQTYLNKRTDEVRQHLWLVLSDPHQDPERVVIANISTDRGKNSGPDCILLPGEHPFVTRQSEIRCAEARITSVAKLDELVQKKLVEQKDDMSAALLAKAQRALRASSLVANGIKRILQSQGF